MLTKQKYKKQMARILTGLIAVAAAFAVGAFTAQEAYADVPISGLYVGNSGEITTTGEIPDTGATSGTATVSTDEENHSIVLTLEDFSYEGEGRSAAIYYYDEMNSSVSLIIKLVGENSVVCTQEGKPGIGLQKNNLIITSDSDGTLDVSGEATGIYNGLKSLTIKDCAVTAAGVDVVSLAVNDGSLDADGVNYGIQVGSAGAAITGDSVVTATGSTKAINGPVKNAIPGKGWADTDGTGVASDILESRNGQQLDYKKVVFALHKHKDAEGNEITFQPWNDKNRLPENGEGNYYLTGDVTLSGAWNVPSGTTNLCLNGYGITGLSDSAIKNSGATLNLYDCNSTQQTHYFTVDSSGLATVDDLVQAGAESFTGGYITGRTVSVDHVPDRGGGVHVLASGTFSMFGGTIIGNAAAFGGGVYIGGNAEFNLIDGSIAYNTVSGSGGGVDVGSYSMGFNMSGGSITNNTADRDAGGINLRKNCTFNMTGGSITDNTANGNRNHDGGGVWVSDQAGCNISGASKITGNKTDGADRNVYLAYGETNHETSKINVDRALSDGAAIGITLGTTDEAGVFTTGLSGKLPDGKPASDIFFSDSTDYSVSETAGGEAQLVVRTDIASGTCSFNDATYAGKEISPQTMTLKLPDTDTRELKLDTDYKITNYKDGNDADMGMAKPKYAGTYKAIVEGIRKYKGNAVVTFTIVQAQPVITTNPTASAITEGQSLADSKFSGGLAKAGDTEVPGTFAWTNSTVKPKASDSGKTEYEVTFTPEDAVNYKTVTTKITLTVNIPVPPATSIDNAPVVLDDAPLTYTGQPVTPVIRTIGGKELQEGRDYTVRYTQGDAVIEAPTDAGTYTMTITGKGNYAGSTSTEFTIGKADGTLAATGNKVKAKSKTVKLKKANKISAEKAYTIEGAIGELTYAKVGASKASKKFKVNATTGQIKVKKGLKKGRYELTVLISDPGDKNHETAEAKAIVKIRIRK